jgi:hypothetical protein
MASAEGIYAMLVVTMIAVTSAAGNVIHVQVQEGNNIF